MTRPNETRPSDAKTPLALATPDFIEVQRQIAAAKQLRAQYMASLFRTAFRALSRAMHLSPAPKSGGPRTA